MPCGIGSLSINLLDNVQIKHQNILTLTTPNPLECIPRFCRVLIDFGQYILYMDTNLTFPLYSILPRPNHNFALNKVLYTYTFTHHWKVHSKYFQLGRGHSFTQLYRIRVAHLQNSTSKCLLGANVIEVCHRPIQGCITQ